MIDRNRLKLLLASVCLGASALVVLGSLAWGAQLQRAVLSGASPRDVFTPIPAVPLDLAPTVRWRPDLPTPRPVEPATRTAVQETWTGALARLDTALRTGDATDLPTNFSGPALEQVLATMSERTTATSQSPLAHDLQVSFYSDDGSILTLRDHGLRLARGLVADDAQSVAGPVVETVESWDVILLLRDGRWRVEHLVRGEVQACPAGCPDRGAPVAGVPTTGRPVA